MSSRSWRGFRSYQYVAQLTPEGWNSQGSAALRQLMQRVSNVARERERFLLIPM
jgi:hypothetical protein